MHIGKTNPKHVYYLNNTRTDILSTTEVEKDLGVTFDCHLNFDKHTYDIVNKASKCIGVIFRSFEYMDVNVFLTLFKSIIRPILEYCNCIWSPLLKRQSILIENVQRRATRLLPVINAYRVVIDILTK
jgi:hypothetical protein